jgi:uncharacterized repeat protein (TIGR03803 family)
MRFTVLAHCAFAVCAAVSILAGCGGGSTPVAPSALSNTGVAPPPRRSDADVIYTFQGGADGRTPVAGLLYANGQFYGTAAGDGVNGAGTAFKISPSGTISTLYSFGSFQDDGNNPYSALIAGPGGVLYGDTVNGGPIPCRCGVVYELVPSGSGYTETVIHAFQGGSDGESPVGSLLLDQSGALYGTTPGGGASPACSNPSYAGGCGTVFKLTPSGSGFTESVLYSFQGGNDGAFPRGGVIADGTGALYGTTVYGGGTSASGCASGSGYESGCGTVFKLTPSGSGYTESILYRFQGGADGANPYSALVAGGNGALFGTTYKGGAVGSYTDSHGTVYELVPSGSVYSEHIILYFDRTNAAFPRDENGLYADSNGNLYGTTFNGGSGVSCGTVFKLAPSRSGFKYRELYRFGGTHVYGVQDGCNPAASVAPDSSGTLYGTTNFGGLHRAFDHHHHLGFGTVFKVSP